jgi:hypothetical protein
MWVHTDGVHKDVNQDIKKVLWPGASCVIRHVFEDFETYENDTEYSCELIGLSGLTQRAIAAGEAFLMLYDPEYSVPIRALHEAFVVEFALHGVSHILNEIDDNQYDLRQTLFPVMETNGWAKDLVGWDDNDLDSWKVAMGGLAVQLGGEGDFEYGVMMHRLDSMGASMVGRLFSSLNLKDPKYFDAYSPEYIEENINQIVTRCAKIIEFIDKFEKSGDFRLHP